MSDPNIHWFILALWVDVMRRTKEMSFRNFCHKVVCSIIRKLYFIEEFE